MKTSRRHFLLMSVSAGSSLVMSRVGFAASANANVLSERDPQALALGYKEDASKVDKAKYPQYAADQKCSTCSLFQGKAADAYGGCTLFGDKQVAAPGWCSSYTNM